MRENKSTAFYILLKTLFKIFIILLISCSISFSQVKIKERIEIKPSDSLRINQMSSEPTLSVTLPSLNMSDFALYGPDFWEYYDDIYDDAIFVPRIGGTMGISLYQQPYGVYQDPHDNMTPREEYLLVFGPDGNIKDQFKLSDLDSTHSVPVCFWLSNWWWYGFTYGWERLSCASGEGAWTVWNPWEFSQALYESTHDTLKSLYPPYKMFFQVKAWEPLRFRLRGNDGSMSKPNNFSWYGYWFDNSNTWYPLPYANDMANSVQAPEYTRSGNLICRVGVDSTDYITDWATYFGMKWFAVDSNAMASSGPPSVDYDDPVTLPDSGMYRIILTSAKPNATGTLSLVAPTNQILFSDIQNSIGDTILLGPYPEGASLQVNYNGTSPSTWYSGYADFDMYFENWTDYDFADVSVRVEYAVLPTDHLELWSTSETIYYGDTLDVDVVPCGSDSLFSPIGEDYYYEFSIELKDSTSKYVELIYNNQGSNLVEHIPSVDRRGVGVKLAANKQEPDSVVDLTFHLKAIYIGGGGGSSSIKNPIISASGDIMEKDIQVTIKPEKAYKITAKEYQKGYMALRKDYSSIVNKQPKKYNGKQIKEKKSQLRFAGEKYSKHRIGGPVAANNKIDGSNGIYQRSNQNFTQGEGGSNVRMANDWGWNMDIPINIMLGQTIYFQAIPDYNRDRKLFLIPFKASEEASPQQCTSVIFGAWKDDNEDEKLGIYWERRNSKGNMLREDIIRIIGRFWNYEEDEPYVDWLNAKSGGREGKIKLKVIKPFKLLTPNQDPTYEKSKDISDNPINIDDICVYYGGKYGVPPHFLKGQMLQEAARWDFGGEVQMGFAPTYVYEPFTAQFWNWNLEKFKNGPWYVDSKRTGKEMGTGKEVPDHKNVHYLTYPSSAVNVWNILQNYSEIENVGTTQEHKQFGWRENGVFKFPEVYTDMNNIYNQILYFSSFEAATSSNPRPVYEIAREHLIEFLRDEWNGGAINIDAQTRLASSYGLLQMMYSTATDYLNYPLNDPQTSPEDLNNTDIGLTYCLTYMKKTLQKKLTPEIEEYGNWPEGYEYYFKTLIWPTWNKDPNYAKLVYSKTQRFLPQNQ